MTWQLVDGDWCHVEIPAKDLGRSRQFYQDVFGWKFIDIPGWEDGQLIKTSDDGIEASLGTLGQSEHITSFVLVKGAIEDMRRKAEQIEAAGGSIFHPPTELPEGMGAFAYVADPEGHVFGLWQD
ncbi:MAG TPA: VOC family protein [Actinomycetota bacterium]